MAFRSQELIIFHLMPINLVDTIVIWWKDANELHSYFVAFLVE